MSIELKVGLTLAMIAIVAYPHKLILEKRIKKIEKWNTDERQRADLKKTCGEDFKPQFIKVDGRTQFEHDFLVRLMPTLKWTTIFSLFVGFFKVIWF